MNSRYIEHGKVVEGSHINIHDFRCVEDPNPMSTSCTFDADKKGCTTNTK